MVQFLRRLWHFLCRALSDLPSSIGSNHLGVWFPLVPAVLFLVYQISQTGWQAVRHDFWVGTIITLVSYGLLFLYCVVRNLYREHVALVERAAKLKSELEYVQNKPSWIGYESEQQWRDSIAFQNKLIELGRSIDGVLSPLQIDALNLRWKLIVFLKQIGPEPACDTSDCLNDPELNAERLTEWHNKVMPFRGRLRSLYTLNFRTDALELYHRFVAAGIRDVHFGSVADVGDSVERIQDLIGTLWTVTGQVEGVAIEKP